MGRRYKVVSEMLGLFRQAAERSGNGHFTRQPCPTTKGGSCSANGGPRPRQRRRRGDTSEAARATFAGSPAAPGRRTESGADPLRFAPTGGANSTAAHLLAHARLRGGQER